LEKNADITVPCIEVPIQDATRFGVIGIDKEQRIIDFEEKPANPKAVPTDSKNALVSMGIYLFNTKILVKRVIDDAKKVSQRDFGKDIIPSMIQSDRVFAFVFNSKDSSKEANYWRDIGTLDAYWEANLDLVQETPVFNLYDKDWPIRTYHEQFPPAKIINKKNESNGMVSNSLISNGCVINSARIDKSVISPGVKIDRNSEIINSVIMEGVVIGKNVRIKNAIIDKSVNIPDGMHIGFHRQEDEKQLTVTEKGIVVAHKEIPLL